MLMPYEHAIVSFLSRAMLSYSHSAISMHSPQYSATELLGEFGLVSAISVSVSLNCSSNRWGDSGDLQPGWSVAHVMSAIRFQESVFSLTCSRLL